MDCEFLSIRSRQIPLNSIDFASLMTSQPIWAQPENLKEIIDGENYVLNRTDSYIIVGKSLLSGVQKSAVVHWALEHSPRLQELS